MIVAVIADNLGGGSARIGESIILGLISDNRVTKVIVYSNSRVNLSPSLKLEVLYSEQISGSTRVDKRAHLVACLSKSAVILNLTNFPIGSCALDGRRELVLLHNAYFFDLPEEVSLLNSPFFVLRNSIARAVMLRWRILFSDPKVTSFLVQSIWMKRVARKSISSRFRIHVIRPYQWLSKNMTSIDVSALTTLDQLSSIVLETCWFYPATGEKHKNHNLLLELLKSSVELNPNIRIILTLPTDRAESKIIINRASELGLSGNIINVGWIKEVEKNYLMANTRGVVFLSRFESQGLPLLEIRDLARPSLVLKSEIAQEVLGENRNLYDLFSTNSAVMLAERKRFSKDLAYGFNTKHTYDISPTTEIQQAYFFDVLESKE